MEWFQHIVVSPIRIANRLLPAMHQRGWGRIIVVGSTGMQHPIPNLALSNTLRASIWAWLKTMSGEVAQERHHDERAGTGGNPDRPDKGLGGSAGAAEEHQIRGGAGRTHGRRCDADSGGSGGDA